MKYMCVDLKSFYASVECILLGKDPNETMLAVCDSERGNGAICLAMSPYLKSFGLSSRARLFEIPDHIKNKVIYAKPKMKKYIEYSCKVFQCYLDFFSEEDIHVYSIDESFINIEPYLKLYKTTPVELAERVLKHVKDTLKLECCAGVGDNMFLAKVALDLYAKHQSNSIMYFDVETFKEKVWDYEPITAIWSIGPGKANRLLKYGVFNLGGVARLDVGVLKHEFGIIGSELYEHAHGIDKTTIAQIKDYVPENKSINTSQILFRDYQKSECLTIVLEMIDVLIMKLIKSNMRASVFSLGVYYGKQVGGGSGQQYTFIRPTNSYTEVSEVLRGIYLNIVQDLPIRKVSITAHKLVSDDFLQLSLFDDINYKEVDLYTAINKVKDKYGKNAVNKALSKTEESTVELRNKLVGGHNGE